MDRYFKNVIIEIRSRLQSVNVLINLSKQIDNLNIFLNESNCEIRSDNEKFVIPLENVNILINSLSSLIKTENYVSFRFATENLFSNFKMELLQLNELKLEENRNVFFEKLISYSVNCKNCDQILNNQLKFDRILPLPSENSDPSDWFCHKSNDLNINLNPKVTDVFYTNSYCHLSASLVNNCLVSEKIVACKRCLSWLGLQINQETTKLWFNTVEFKNASGTYSTIPLNDVNCVVKDALRNSLLNSVKLILYCQSSTNKVDRVLIWILEKKLNVILWDNECNFKELNVAKVLFKCEDNNGDLFKQWENDISVVCVCISKPMIVDVLKHLYKFNKIFPKEFSESNGFFVSYLMLYDN